MKQIKPKQHAFILLAGLLAVTSFAGCSNEKSTSSSTAEKQSVTTVKDEKLAATAAEELTEDATEAETTIAETTVHISPMETISTILGTELTDLNVILDRDGENTYKASLADFIQTGDMIQSFTFIFYAEDGVSDLVSYKGGCGISVTDDCPSATDEGWYQSDDFSQSVNGAYAEITWDVPSDLISYIDPDGEVLIGYWWSEQQMVKLSSIVCTYTRTAELPVDGISEISPLVQLENEVLSSQSDPVNTAKIKLSDLITTGDTLQTVTFDISGDGRALGKFTGAFGVSVEDSCKASTDDNWYQTDNVVVFTQSGTVSLTWIIPEEIKTYIPADGELMLGYWWSDLASVTLEKVSVRYSNTTGTATKTTVKTEQEQEGVVSHENAAVVSSEEVNQMTSAEIVADMKIGWNLGNTLDSYDTDNRDTETGWGNPKTTKAMIDLVKAAGFNAVRIPVTWGEHLSSDHTVETAWMDRVQEVVDYAMDNDLYVILNVHHDDAIWLHPTYHEQAEVEATLTSLWKQICDRFQNYDHHLVFEGMNETRVIGSATEWTGGTEEERDVINQLYQTFVDTVRAAGGLHKDRTLIISSHAQSITEQAVSAVKIPNDDHIVVSIHSYAPWDFCGTDDARADWGSISDKKELDDNFQYLTDMFIQKGIPVVLDEFGAVNKNNTSVRATYYAYYVQSAKEHGITCFVWDNGIEDEFGLLNRKNLTWYTPSIIDAMMQVF